MKRTTALRELLESLSTIYNDGDQVDVRFDSSSYAHPDGWVAVAPNVRDTLGRNLSGPDELRVVVNTLSHEIEHIRESPLRAKAAIEDEYDGYGKVAGAVYNIVEDQYIDFTRTRRFRGLRKAQAFKIDAIMENHHRRPRIDKLDKPEALVEGFLQVAFAGYVKGIDGAPDDVRRFLAYAQKRVNQARRLHDHDERVAVAREITDEMLALFPPAPDIDFIDLRDLIEKLPTDDANGDLDPDTVPDIGIDITDDPGPADGEDQPGGDGQDDPDADVPDDQDQDADDGQGTLDDFDPDADDDASGTGSAGDGQDDPDADMPGQSPGSQTGPDTVTDEDLDRLDKASDERDAGDWYDAGGDYEEADETDERRYDRLQARIGQERLLAPDPDAPTTEERRADRQSKRAINSASIARKGTTSDDVRQKLRESGLAQRVETAFREFATQDAPEPATAGAELNLPAYARRRAGDMREDELFYEYQPVESGDRAIGVALDMSSSMDEMEAKVALGALYIATRAIGDDLVASAYRSSNDEPVIDPLFGPGEAFRWEYLDATRSSGCTPTPAGIYDAYHLLQETTRREQVLIVITDGEANVNLHGGGSEDSAIPQSAKLVAEARARGTKVIGLGVGGVREDMMADIFGTEGYVTAGMDQLTDVLIDTYRQQMKTAGAAR